MPDPLVAADLDLPLDVLGDLSPEVSFDLQVLVDERADLEHLVFREVTDLGPALDAGPGHDLYARVGPMP